MPGWDSYPLRNADLSRRTPGSDFAVEAIQRLYSKVPKKEFEMARIYLLLCVFGAVFPYILIPPWLLEHGLDIKLRERAITQTG